MSIVDELKEQFGEYNVNRQKKSVEVSLPEIQDKIERWKDAKERKDTAKADLNELKEEIGEVAEQVRQDLSEREGKVIKTLEINRDVRFGVQRRYVVDGSKSSRAKLEEIFGSDYEHLFDESLKLSFTKKALNDEGFLETLRAFLGDTFGDYIDVKIKIKPNKKYHKDRHLDPDVRSKHNQAEKEGIIRPYSPRMQKVDNS